MSPWPSAARASPSASSMKRSSSVTRGRLDTEVLVQDAGLGAKALRFALEHDASLAHHVDALGDAEREREVLLDEEDRHAGPAQLREDVAHLFDQAGRVAFGN